MEMGMSLVTSNMLTQVARQSLEMPICFFHLFFLVLLTWLGAGSGFEDNCTELPRCGNYGNHPAIQSDRCAYPRFNLSCIQNDAIMLDLLLPDPIYVDKIDYESQLIHLRGPMYSDYCVPKSQFFPFQLLQDKSNSNYTLFSCTSSVGIECSTGPGYGVYAIPSDALVTYRNLTSCRKMHSNFSAKYQVIERPQVFQLYWSKPMCTECDSQRKYCTSKTYSTKQETQCSDINKHHIAGAREKLKLPGVIMCVILVTLVFIVVLYRIYRSNILKIEDEVRIEKFLEDYRALKPTRYSYADIKRITNQFKDKLGQGGYGTVFKGKVSNEVYVAVKVLDNNNFKGNGEEFINEVGTIGRIHHVNVVRLLGYCADGFRRALVYEFLPNDSLENFIRSGNQKKHSPSWEKLQDIVLGIAKGIEYLHQGCDQRILHFDIKPHNILLDHNLNPKIADFGLAKLCSKEKSIVSMTTVRGTMGYIAPEVFSRNFGNVSYKSDVYSFGILLLEMVKGKKNINVKAQDTNQAYFPEWVYNCLKQGEELGIQIDEEEDPKIAKKLIIVGLWCIQWHPIDRLAINIVVQMLEGDGDTLTMPANPFASTNPLKTNPTNRGKGLNIELAVISELEGDN